MKRKNIAAYVKKINLALVVKEGMAKPMITLIMMEASDKDMNLSTARGQGTHRKTKLVEVKNAIDMNLIEIIPSPNSTTVTIE